MQGLLSYVLLTARAHGAAAAGRLVGCERRGLCCGDIRLEAERDGRRMLGDLADEPERDGGDERGRA